jgi:hypothetical protein
MHEPVVIASVISAVSAIIVALINRGEPSNKKRHQSNRR